VDGDLQKQMQALRMKVIVQRLAKAGETAKEDQVLQVGEQIKKMLVLLEVLKADGVTTIPTKEVEIILREEMEEEDLITTTTIIIVEDIKSLKKEIDKEVGDSIIIVKMEVVGV